MQAFNRSFNFRFITSIALGVMLSATVAFGQNGNPNPGVHPPNSKPYGLTYDQWSARWWQWIFSIPSAVNPNLEGTALDPDPTTVHDCAQGQSGQVWFLGGRFNSGPTTERACTIPAGRSLLFPVLTI